MTAQESIRNALEIQGNTTLGAVHRNLPTSYLYEEIVQRRVGRLAHLGPPVAVARALSAVSAIDGTPLLTKAGG